MRDGLQKLKLNPTINLCEDDFDELSESGSASISALSFSISLLVHLHFQISFKSTLYNAAAESMLSQNCLAKIVPACVHTTVCC